MDDQWITAAFTIGGVLIGTGGTVFGNWTTARFQSTDKVSELRHALLQNTREEVLSQITRYIIVTDSFISSLKLFKTAVETAWDKRLDQKVNDDDIQRALEHPGSYDLAELKAHSRTVDRELEEAVDHVEAALRSLQAVCAELESTSPLCEIVAPPLIATHVERLTSEALKLTQKLGATDWQVVAEQDGVPDDEFVSMRRQVTASTRDWSYPSQTR
ncbi:hypothetical protein NGF75_00855 [Dietzia kunjamensis]|uniref:hypothetical protein n=1 Tax=Dietzia kunjamensis TaxID=322509 RepID=UPI002DBF8336|nr:hypothetical protein [Dietzia kunjamensis]MEB8324536.1 hypothetical protein [Dietzia kunjamensis]